jgi:uncharacterized repeat protein (TIGR01451 family)
MNSRAHFHTGQRCGIALLCLWMASSAVAQVRPLTGISAHYDNVSDTNGNYSVTGAGTSGFPSGTVYNLTFNTGGAQNNLIIDGFESGTNIYNYVQLAQQINIVRVDNPTVTGAHNIVFFEESSVSGTNVNLKPSRVSTMDESLRSDLVNRGADNVFANQGDGNGNMNNIERIDYIFSSGFPYYDLTDRRGFLVMDRGGNDRFKIAVITAIDTNGLPASFSQPVSVEETSWGASGITLQTTVMRGYTEGGGSLTPSARVGAQSLSGVYLSWDEFALTTNDMIYGYSLAANDVTTNNAYWLETTNPAYFPTDTAVGSQYGGLDLISGGSMFFDETLDVGLGDRVWNDWNADGIQDASEPGLSNVLVHIYNESTTLVATARSDADGYYSRQGIGTGTFTVQFFPPSGYSFSPQYARTEPELDSNPNATSGITDPVVLGLGQTNRTIDAGLFSNAGDLRLTKTVSSTTLNVGDSVVYTLELTNASTPLTSFIQVTDVLPAAVVFSGYGATTGAFSSTSGVWDVGSMVAGAAATLTITGTVNAGCGGDGVTNTASVTQMDRSDFNLADNTASAVFQVQSADLSVSKESDLSEQEEGSSILFTITVTNHGPDAASEIRITDPLPSGFSFVSANPSQGVYSNAVGLWYLGALTNGGSAALEIDASAMVGSCGLTFTNTAAVDASSHEDPVAGNNSDSVVVLVSGADLALTKTVDNSTPNETSQVVYTLQLTNSGPSDVTGVSVSEPLTNGLTYLSSVPSQGSYNSTSGIWSVGAMALGDIAALELTAQVQTNTFGATITNTCRITAVDLLDPASANDEAEAVLTVSGLQVSKTSDVSGEAQPGDVIAYTIVVSNLSAIAHTGIQIEDVLPTPIVYEADSSWITGPGTNSAAGDAPPLLATNLSLEAGTELTVTFNAVVVNPGTTTQLLNTVSVTCDQQSTPVEASVADRVIHTDLGISKMVDDLLPDEGATVEYTLVVTNQGPNTATNILVSEPLTNGLTYASHLAGQGTYNSTSGVWSVGGLDVGVSAQLQISATVDEGTAGNTLTNRAWISSAGAADLVFGNNEAAAETTVVSVDVGLGKSADSLVPVENGPLVYTVTVTNFGADTATGVQVTDLLPTNVTYGSHAAGQGTYNSTSGVWTVGTLDALQTSILTLTTVVKTNTTGQAITNTASVTAVDQVDVAAPNDTASVVVTPTLAVLTLVKTALPAGPVWAGEIITYSITATNQDVVTHTNVTVTDPLPTGAAYVAGSCQVSAWVTVNQTFFDQFNRRVWSNNDGTETWAGDWVEGEADGPTLGSIQMQFNNGVEETYTLRITDENQWLRREADLSSYDSATLEFDYQRVGLEAGEYVALDISSTGAAGPWTELDRFEGEATDAEYIHFDQDISAYMSTSTVIRFSSPSGMNSTDIMWIDDLLITGTRRLTQTVAGGAPPNLTSGNTLLADEGLDITFDVWVENPTLYDEIVNRASLTSAQAPIPQIATAVTPVDTCQDTAPIGLTADPTNVTAFTAHWSEVPGTVGYLLDVSTDSAFASTVPGYSNRAVASLSQAVTGLTHNVTHYFRVRAEWGGLCTGAHSATQAVTTLDMPSIWVFPEELDFGVVQVSDSSNLVLIVTNSSGTALIVDGIEFTGTGSNDFSVLPSTSSIPAQSSVELTVTFAPTAHQTNELVMTLSNDSLDAPEFDVPVRGVGFDLIALPPEVLDYRVIDAAALTNEVTDSSLAEGAALVDFTVYHAMGMTLTGATFDLLYPDGSTATLDTPFSEMTATTFNGQDCQKLSATVPRFFPAALGTYTARVTVASSNGVWLTDEARFTSVPLTVDTSCLLDNFNRTDVSGDIGQGWLSVITGPVSGNIQIENRYLKLLGPDGTGGTNGRISVVRDVSSRYDPILTNNAGTLVWAFNFYSGCTNQLGLAPGAYGSVFVLGSDSTNWVSGSGNGYAVGIRSNQIEVASFSGGLDLDSDLIPIGVADTLSSATVSVAVQVELDVATGIWRLYVHEWGGSGIGAFDDPLTDMASYGVGQATNTIYLDRSLPYVGCVWNHGNAAAQADTAACFDDLYAFVKPETAPMNFASVDNDIMYPTLLGTVRVNGDPVPEAVPSRFEVVWTHTPEFIVTFDSLAIDQDPGYPTPAIQRDIRGMGEYRVSAEAVDGLTTAVRAQQGLPFPVITTNGALANYGFEIPPSDGDWVLDDQCSLQTRTSNPALVYEGSNSLCQAAGGAAVQVFEFRNAAGVTPLVSMTGWIRGGPAEVSIAAYATNDLENPVETATLSPAAVTNWTSFSLPEQALGGSSVEILKVTLTASNDWTYWDDLRFSVDIGTNRPSMRFQAGSDNQGLVPLYLFGVDADHNRGSDRLAGASKYFYIPFDMTPPTPVNMPLGGTGATTDTVNDPTTQFDLNWSTSGVGPDDPDSPVHPTMNSGDIDLMSPWHSYKVYYGPFDSQSVPPGDDPTSTDGYIYTNYVETGTYLSWSFICPTSSIADPAAPLYQSTYGALTNLGTSSIRLYDLDFDQEYVVVVVGVDEAGNEGNVGVQSWATNNTIRFAMIRGTTIAKCDAESAFPEANSLCNSNISRASAMYWIASGATNEQGEYTAVWKDYDLISWDAGGFQESSNNQWQLLGTTRTNWFVDDGGLSRSRGQLRFYRASNKGRWERTNTLGQVQRPMASEEVYTVHNVVLSGGQNFVALHGAPTANTFQDVFGGLECFPGGPSAMPASGATFVEFYTAGVTALTTEQYYLNTSGQWILVGGGEVTSVLQEADFFTRGFSITLPDPLPTNYVQTTALDISQKDVDGNPLQVPAMVWSPIVQVPTNGYSQTIHTGSKLGRVSTLVYNLAALRLPISAHPDEMRLLESGFVNGSRGSSDEIYTMNTATKSVLSGSTIYCDASGTWRMMRDDSLVPGGYFKPNDVIVIVSRNGGIGNSWTWTYDPGHFYDLPTRWMEPTP